MRGRAGVILVTLIVLAIVSASIFVFYVTRSTEYRVEATILKPKQPPPPKVRKPVIEEESESSVRIEESTEVDD